MIDKWGPGSRVPALVISPLAKHGFVDHTQYDTSSILALIESRWGLDPLTHRDRTANNMLNAFNFEQGVGRQTTRYAKNFLPAVSSREEEPALMGGFDYLGLVPSGAANALRIRWSAGYRTSYAHKSLAD